ncbi:MAG: CPBP family intramembrane metalloprotease [Chloroflexi bacterium]|nr:CPBP family intramembrane metalloprotease [Chloroflexota bacterium]
MNHLSSESLVKEQGRINAPTSSRAMLILTAWLGTLLLSRLPQIILSELGVAPFSEWSMWWWIVVGIALVALTFVWSAVRPLRGYFLIMTMIYVVTIGMSWLTGTSVWVSWFGPDKPWLILSFGDRLGIVLTALALAGVLALMGQKRGDFFFTLGNINAPAEGMRLRWKVAGPLIALLLTALFTAGILAMNSLSITIADILPILPMVFILAMMNAFGEEMAYRAAPLSQLWQIVGKRQAVWMMALWFGLGHYYGGVSFGAAGVIYLTLLAVLFGKAMVETKGLGIPVFMHLWGDLVLYILLALGSA